MNEDKTQNGTTASQLSRPLDLLYYYTIISIVKIISYIPFWLLYGISDILFYPLYYIVRYRRKIVRKNLTESFPDKSLSEIKQIERNFYHFFIDVILESCKLISISPQEMKRRVKFVNIEILNEKIHQGKNISVYIGHLGNWEWLASSGLWLSKEAQGVQIYHQLHNKTMDKLMKGMRERMGNTCVDMNQTVQFIANAKRNNEQLIIGFIADQSPKRSASKHFIKFLNHEVPVLTGTEKLTKHFHFEAAYFGLKRIKRGYYECEVASLHENPEVLPDFELTNIYFQRLEREIMQQPECYLWTHNRFKYAHKTDSLSD